MSYKIVSVQDISCYGQCSLTVALPILSALGVETAILPSAILSTHTGGFTGFTVLDLTEEMPKILKHWINEGIKFDAIYTGYIGDTRQFDIINEAKAKILNPGGLLICDPAMADHGKLYPALNTDIVDGMKKLVAKSDIILPNLTEAVFLLGEEYTEDYDRAYIENLLKKLAALGPKTVILTGVSFEEGRLGAIAYDKETGKITEYYTERIARNYHGTGDVFSSVLAGAFVLGVDRTKALKIAADYTALSIAETLKNPENPWYGVDFEAVIPELIESLKRVEEE